jgi:dihydrofolate synthase / folylpolyglutamate synthase
MTYAEAIDFLYSLRSFGTKFGLENTIALARLNGNPHEKLRFIHVAGTNGKGSTCAMLESIYRADGLRTGLFTSPHLVSFTERIQVNRVCIAEEEVACLTQRIILSMGGSDTNSWAFHPTFFEFVTIMALLHFQEQRCELIIWETGLGGRLDATNIVVPLASVITNVQYDHQQWLGSTLDLIATEKAGIIKRAVPVITGASEPKALEVIRATARALDAPLTEVSGLADIDLPLPGEHQRGNAAVALATVNVLRPQLPVSDEAIRRGLESLNWPGRLQMVGQGATEILLDGAHNPAGARTLAAALQNDFGGRAFTLILGLFADKSWKEICEVLVPLARRVLLVPLPSPRTADVSEVRDYCAAKWPQVPADTSESVGAAIANSNDEPFRVIAGSLHLVGEAMEALRISPTTRSERALNEWNAANRAS